MTGFYSTSQDQEKPRPPKLGKDVLFPILLFNRPAYEAVNQF